MNANIESSRHPRAAMQMKDSVTFGFSTMPTIARVVIVIIILLAFNCVIFPNVIVPIAFTHVSYMDLIHSIYLSCYWLFLGLIIFSIMSYIHTRTSYISIQQSSIVYVRGLFFIRKQIIDVNQIANVDITQSSWQNWFHVATLLIETKGEMQKNTMRHMKKSKRKISSRKRLAFKNLDNAEQAFEVITQMLYSPPHERIDISC